MNGFVFISSKDRVNVNPRVLFVQQQIQGVLEGDNTQRDGGELRRKQTRGLEVPFLLIIE
jgi:hypothetical protein